MGFAYPFILINILSFRYCSLTHFLLFHLWCLSFPPWGGEKGHQEIRICLRQYMGGD
jgi:hypothetical protein